MGLEIKQKIIEIFKKLDKIKDNKKNKEKIFELCYELRLLTQKEKKFKEIFINLELNEKYKNACILILNNSKSGKYEKDWVEYKLSRGD